MTDEPTAVAYDYEAVRALTGGSLAVAVLELIEDNIDRWYQGAWRQDIGPDGNYLQPCDGISGPTVLEAFAEDPLNPACTTAFCFAGWTAAIKGVKWAKGDQETIGDPERCDCTTPCCIVMDHQIGLPSYARRVLGIRNHEGDMLFNGDNDIYSLRQMVESLDRYGEIDSDDEYDGDDDDDDE
jgi:hypothetical protein